MSQIPRDKAFDSTLALLSDGYTFISKRCRRYQSDIFQTRLMLSKVICMQGEEAAQLLYSGDRFTRKGGAPKPTLKLLQDVGSVQQLEGEAHRYRKRMFMSLMAPAAIQQLTERAAGQWRARIAKWERMDRVVLFPEVQEMLCRAVCSWAGVPLPERDARRRTREFAAMIDGAGAVGPRNWRGLLLRARTERWIRTVIERVRTYKLEVPDGCAIHVIAWHRDHRGELLDAKTAAVEVINVIRPTVAVAWFVTFAALALHTYPQCRERLLDGDDDDIERFVQEVRRFYPFFPLVGARVASEFEWRGHPFSRGTWMLLDLYGTNHDARIWDDPEAFRPERFRDWDGNAFTLVPQGAGDYYTSHRCPGEWITIALMKSAVHLLTTAIRYDVPKQDLRVDLSRMPAIPKSRFVISNVRQV